MAYKYAWLNVHDVNLKPPSECFDNAIATGFLTASTITGSGTTNTSNDKWAGNWMYMYSKLGVDYFKNKNTRDYIEVPHY